MTTTTIIITTTTTTSSAWLMGKYLMGSDRKAAGASLAAFLVSGAA
jgi:hypothetical protein